MRTFKILLITLAILLGIAYATKAQDTTRTPIGYDVDYPFVYARKDTIHGMTQLYNHYPHKMYFSVNGGRALELRRGGVLTVWSNHFTCTVTRKKYKRIYQF
jgi:hypothetical protein